MDREVLHKKDKINERGKRRKVGRKRIIWKERGKMKGEIAI